MSLFISIDVLQILPYLLMIFLHTDHLLPLPLSHIPHLLYCHYSHLLNLMINLFVVKWLSLN